MSDAWTVVFSTIAGGVAGIVLAITLMGPPTGVQPASGCGPATLIRDAGFDPWTGQPRGDVIEGRCIDHDYVDERPLPAALVGRTGFPWASAMALGSGLGGLIVGWALWRLQRSRSRR